MLTGQYSHSLDAKGRVNFPARLREELGERFVITRGLDSCLFVYSMEEWKLLADKLHQLPISKSAASVKQYMNKADLKLASESQYSFILEKLD